MEYGAVVVWWVALLGLGAVGLPIAGTLLRALPDRGAGLALPTALVVLFVPVYWIGHVWFGTATIVLGALLLAILSIGAHRRTPAIDHGRFAEWAVVFSLGFLLLIVVRAVDPSIVPAGGEKFLDYGLLQSLLRASSLPPEDMWFAGEPVAYYYGGHLLAASLATLTDTAPRYAYNLALAGFFGALVGAAYGVAGSAAAARGRSYRWAGALGAFLAGVASNVVPLVQAVLWTLPDRVAAPTARALSDRTALPAERLLSPETFSYWTASRVIPGTINEFPLFAFINGDLHAHMTSTPFTLLVVGLGLAYYLTPGEAIRRRRLLVFGAVPPVAGLLAVVNTWSLPTAAGIVGLSVLFAPPAPRDLLPRRLARRLPTEAVSGELSRMASAMAVAAGVAVLSVAWALPFVLGPATGAEGRSLEFFPDRSGPLAFLLVHGWFLLVYALYLGAAARTDGLEGRLRLVAALTVIAVGVGLLADVAAVAFVLPPMLLAWYLLRRRGPVGFESLLFVAGGGLLLLVEFLYVSEQAGPGRFNTVFKTYAQVWVLWATGAGAALASFLPRPGVSPRVRHRAAIGFVALLVAASSIYGVAAVGGHVDGASEPTLDGTTWARSAHSAEWEAIRFLDRQPGRPVIVTAPGCWCNDVDSIRPYGWANAPSTFTGLPTVAGWSHEVGYRGQAAYDDRVADVRRIYTGSAAERRGLLEAYDVRFVYVGPNERALYELGDLAETPGLSVAFENDAVTIYAVNGTAT